MCFRSHSRNCVVIGDGVGGSASSNGDGGQSATPPHREFDGQGRATAMAGNSTKCFNEFQAWLN